MRDFLKVSVFLSACFFALMYAAESGSEFVDAHFMYHIRGW